MNRLRRFSSNSAPREPKFLFERRARREAVEPALFIAKSPDLLSVTPGALGGVLGVNSDCNTGFAWILLLVLQVGHR